MPGLRILSRKPGPDPRRRCRLAVRAQERPVASALTPVKPPPTVRNGRAISLVGGAIFSAGPFGSAGNRFEGNSFEGNRVSPGTGGKGGDGGKGMFGGPGGAGGHGCGGCPTPNAGG